MKQKEHKKCSEESKGRPDMYSVRADRNLPEQQQQTNKQKKKKKKNSK